MKINYRYTLILILVQIVSTVLQVFAQSDDKVEIEQRIESSAVPESAKSWLNQYFENQGKVKWYKESGSDGYNFEAKFKKDKKKYSVEFSDNGNFEDVEIVVKLSTLNTTGFNKIKNYLDENYTKYKIIKVQARIQSDVQAAISEVENNKYGLVSFYEIEFIGKNGKSSNVFEAVFDAEGNLSSLRKVVPNSSDNLSY